MAGVLTLIGALVCAELSSAYPRTGGVYVFLKEIYSPSLGFLWGWAMFWTHAQRHPGGDRDGVCALCGILRAARRHRPRALVAIGAILVLSAINYVGVRFGSGVQSAFTLVKVLAVLAIIILGWALSGDVQPPALDNVRTRPSRWRTSLLAVGAGLFAFGGWHMVTYTAEETVNPTRTIPRSLMIGIAVVTVCYIGLNAVYLRVLPIEKVMTSTRVAADTFEVLIGRGRRRRDLRARHVQRLRRAERHRHGRPARLLPDGAGRLDVPVVRPPASDASRPPIARSSCRRSGRRCW